MARKLLKKDMGVELWEITADARRGKGGDHYRICTKRSLQPWVRTDREQAEREWAREVEASTKDPLVPLIVARGL